MRPRRLPEAREEAIDRSRPISFELDGRALEGYAGDTVGSAMAASGVDIVSRSFKYHRPRGLLCMTGSCPNCLVDVDGVPNVRACTEPLVAGMRVRRQNAWPSASHDVHGALNMLSFMMPPGFYYKIFQRPRWAWHAVEPFIRSRAGLGVVPEADGDGGHAARVNLHPDVVVIGGGPAGLAAAAEAARSGAATVLLEQRREVGGRLLARAEGTARARELGEAARAAGVRILAGTPAFGVFDGPLVAAASVDALVRVRARRLIVATGSVEQANVFPNNDLPGIMLSSAADALVHRYRVLPGRRAVVLAMDERGYDTAGALASEGADVTIVDPRPEAGSAPPPAASRRDAGRRPVEVVPGVTVLRAYGRRRLRAVEIGPPVASAGRRLPCDLLVIAGLEVPSTNLLAQAGARLAFHERSQTFLPVELPRSLLAAGSVAGARSHESAIAQGRAAGAGAAADLGHVVASPDAAGPDGPTLAQEPNAPVLPPARTARRGKQFACLCMDVTDKELAFAVREGFDSMELLKRYTTVTMGPCQGKACMLSSQRLCGAATGRALADTPPTTLRPPWTPVELRTLAGGRRTPRKETSLHDRHADAGAEFMWAGDWRRPHHYTTPEAEVAAVRERVGVIDVSSLGKFRVKGADAVALLEQLYPNRFGDLRTGRIRYGVMLNDEGVVLDDGTVCRLSDDEFFVTVTTGNTAAIERWMTWWLADWGLDVRVLNVTGAYAAVNLAGPASRRAMERLTDADVSSDALPYLTCSAMEVAGVPALVLRIGFVGELGYEIHFPSMYGHHVWDAILEAGRDLGIVPFGLEAQRILRLEKQHILVGQDTDAESDPFEVGLGWMVKLDKADFLGKRSLVELDREGPSERLVGFTADPAIVPPEGASVVRDGVFVGRVTSARRSHAAGRVIGLAWVPVGWAQEGTPFDIEFGGARVHATVRLRPFYDPEGARLRS